MVVNIAHTHMKMLHLPKKKHSLPKEGKTKTSDDPDDIVIKDDKILNFKAVLWLPVIAD